MVSSTVLNTLHTSAQNRRSLGRFPLSFTTIKLIEFIYPMRNIGLFSCRHSNFQALALSRRNSNYGKIYTTIPNFTSLIPVFSHNDCLCHICFNKIRAQIFPGWLAYLHQLIPADMNYMVVNYQRQKQCIALHFLISSPNKATCWIMLAKSCN